ncbi:MAG: LEPR-XLL domain-containing protein, partial [Candidatus Accumulibacter meliphilus]
MSRKSERSVKESRRIGAALVARIPAVCRNVLASFGRARHSPSSVTPPFPRKIVFEALEPRVLLAADLPVTTVASASLDANHQQLLDPGSDQGVVVVLAAAAASESEPVAEVEGNDTRITATALPLAEDPAGSGLLLGRGMGRQDPAVNYNSWSDADYWRVELQAGDLVSVSVDTPDSDVNAVVELRNAADGALATSDNEGPGSDAFISRLAVTASGSYYVVVGK